MACWADRSCRLEIEHRLHLIPTVESAHANGRIGRRIVWIFTPAEFVPHGQAAICCRAIGKVELSAIDTKVGLCVRVVTVIEDHDRSGRSGAAKIRTWMSDELGWRIDRREQWKAAA